MADFVFLSIHLLKLSPIRSIRSTFCCVCSYLCRNHCGLGCHNKQICMSVSVHVCVCMHVYVCMWLSVGRQTLMLRCSGELQPYSVLATIQQKRGKTDRLPGMFSTDTLWTALYYLYQGGWVRGGAEGGGGNEGKRYNEKERRQREWKCCQIEM